MKTTSEMKMSSKMKTTSKYRWPQNEDNIKNEDNLVMNTTCLYMKTTSNWEQPDLEDRNWPELTQPWLCLLSSQCMLDELNTRFITFLFAHYGKYYKVNSTLWKLSAFLPQNSSTFLIVFGILYLIYFTHCEIWNILLSILWKF